MMLRTLLLAAVIAASPATGRADTPATAAQALASIERGAVDSRSDAVHVERDGKVLLDYRRPGAATDGIEMMSDTKSLVALGVGRLLTQGKIRSIDQPVSDFYPEWKQGRKAKITLRMLLNHTSGLQNEPNTGLEIYPAADGLQLALAAELSDDPGSKFSYNNKAMNLLAGVFDKAAQTRMDLYIERELMAPMGMTSGKWNDDGFDKAGHPYAMAGWNSTAADAAKIGQLMLDGGRWKGQQLVDAGYMREMVAQSQPYSASYGLLWWRRSAWYGFDDAALARLRAAGIDTPYVDAVASLRGRRFGTDDAAAEALVAVLGKERFTALRTQMAERSVAPPGLLSRGPVVAYQADGYLGQYIVVVPKARLVAVRQIAYIAGSDPEQDWPYGYSDFTARVIALAATDAKDLSVDAP